MVALCILCQYFFMTVFYIPICLVRKGVGGWVGWGWGVVWTFLTGRDNRIMDRGPCASSFVMGQLSFSGITLFSCCFSSQGD